MPRDLDELVLQTLSKSQTLKSISKQFRGLLTSAFVESPLRPLKNLLNGTWLEHPLHPVITDIPIGAWTAALALDGATLFLGVPNLGQASGIAIGVGTAGAVGALVTGLMDYTDTSTPEDTTALTHGIFNTAATLLFTASFVARAQNNWRTEPSYVTLAALGYAAVIAGGFLGGSLIFRHGVMINRNAHRSKPKKFTRAIALKELEENKPTRIDVEGEPILIVKRGDNLYAVGAVCSHLGGPLEKGKLQGDIIECPWHYSHFSIADGSVRAGPTTAPIPLYDTQVTDGYVSIRLHAE